MNARGYEDIGVDQVLSAAEGIQHKRLIAEANQRNQRRIAEMVGDDPAGGGPWIPVLVWRWMGNYESPTEVAEVANADPACGAGALITAFHNGIYPAWMYF